MPNGTSKLRSHSCWKSHENCLSSALRLGHNHRRRKQHLEDICRWSIPLCTTSLLDGCRLLRGPRQNPHSDPSQSRNRSTNLASTLMSTTGVLRKIPPTIIFMARFDPLQAGGGEFGHRLQQVGVPTAIFRSYGQVHDCAMLIPIASSPTAAAAIGLASLKLK